MLLMVSCLEEQTFNEITPNPNQEVSFTAKVDGPETKTLYGLVDGNAVKLKWVHDDKISVYGTTCAEGRKQAEYAVKTYEKITNEEDGSTTVTDNIVAATPNTEDGQNYADELVKTGAAGVQWGTEPNCDFYAVYPSVADGAFSLASDKDPVTVKTSVSTVQYLSFKSSSTLLQGIPYDSNLKKYGMNNAIMYACTPNQQSSATTVDLSFKPFSTVLKFTIPTWTGSTASGLGTAPTGNSIIVKSITLTAPKKVFGEFDLQIKSDGTAVVKPSTEGTSNTVTITPSEQLKWTYNQALEFSVFAIPLADVPMEGWQVAIDFTTTVTSNNQTQNKDVSKTFTFGTTEKNLLAGSIHNIKVKSGFTVDAVWEYNTDSWLETIPRNVYISDISLPGSWYALDSGYQSGTLQQQYDAGVRAFNIDCRLSLSPGISLSDYYKSMLDPTYVDNMTHLFKSDANNNKIYTTDILTLTCAGTEEIKRNTLLVPVSVSSLTSVRDALDQICTLAASKQDEYVEVILTVAQKPKSVNHVVAYTFGTVNAEMVLTAITNVLNDSIFDNRIYGTKEGEQITPNTTLKDVCGKVVVKVNINTSEEKFKTWNLSAPMLISEGSMAESKDENKNITAGTFNKMNSPSMYWSNIYSLPSTQATANSYANMTYYYHQAQNTSGLNDFPDIDARKEAILDILTNSYKIYHQNTHNALFQIGIGGWTGEPNNEDKDGASQPLKQFVYEIIQAMLTKTPYDPDGETGTKYEAMTFEPAPVGAVLMNHSTAGTTHNTQALIDAIIELNGTYFLNRDVTKPEWPE